MGRYFDFNLEVVAGDDQSVRFQWADASGDPVDVSDWDVYYKATSDSTTDTLTVAPGQVTFSDSGSGTTDTFTILLPNSSTDIDDGFYTQEIAVVRDGSTIETIARGTLTIVERVTEVTL